MRTIKCIFIWKLSVILIFATFCGGTSHNWEYHKKECRTRECVDTASYILSHMDPTISPCDNFYKFACGRFSSSTNETVSYAMKGALSAIILPHLNDIFRPKSYCNLEPGLQKAYTFYEACTRINMSLSEATELILQKMPELNFWDANRDTSTESSWIELIRKSRNLGLETDYIVSVLLAFNPENSSTFILRILPPSIDYRGWKFLKASTSETSKRMMNGLQKMINETRSFQKGLKNILVLSEPSPLFPEYWNQTYSTTVFNLQKEYPSVDWTKLLQVIVGPAVTITESQILSIHSRRFISNLEKLLNETQKSVIADYLKIRLLNKWADIVQDFYPIQTDENCRENTQTLFGKVIVLKILKLFFREDKKVSLQDMMARMKEEMRKNFQTSMWINEDVRRKLVSKLDAIGETIGSDESISKLDYTVNNIYRNMHSSSNDYFDLLLSAIKLGSDLKFSILQDPSLLRIQRLDQTNWPTVPFYQPNIETIIVPGSFLTNFMYTANRPNYVNYGLIGFILGHELMHAFQKNGILIDEYGNVENIWTSDMELEYSKRLECLVKKYDSIPIDGTDKKINGARTLNENLSDNEGVRAAYGGYKRWLVEHPYEQSLPNLNYTSEQMFWISNANLWCAYLPLEELQKKVPTYTHSPPWDRVNAVFSNLEEFAADFGCATNSKMNSPQKCSIW